MRTIRRGDYALEVHNLTESTYYRLVNRAGPGVSTILELQIYDSGYCVDFIKLRGKLEQVLDDLTKLERGPCGIA